jgi:glycosyltransferase involved in cell wall biosynthesis
VEFFRARLAERGSGSGAGKGYALEYAGQAAHADMRRHYDWAGVLVIPSLMENYPYVALEGLSRGCFLVGSDVGGIPEIIDRPERGALFPTENSAFLAGVMGEYRDRIHDRTAILRRNAEEMSAEFSPDACYGRLLKAYGIGNEADAEERAA